MRHHKPRQHPAKEQRHTAAVNDAERRALEGLDFSKEPPTTKTNVVIRDGRPKRKARRK